MRLREAPARRVAWVRRVGRAEDGTVLALVPAAFMVLVLLAALAVDSAEAYQAQGQLHDALAAAANDAVAAGLSNSRFYAGQGVGLDPGLTEAVVCQAMAAQDVGSSLHGLRVSMAISGDSIRLSGSASVVAVFGRAIPGFGTRPVRSSAGATLSAGAAPPAVSFPAPQPVSCVS